MGLFIFSSIDTCTHDKHGNTVYHENAAAVAVSEKTVTVDTALNDEAPLFDGAGVDLGAGAVVVGVGTTVVGAGAMLAALDLLPALAPSSVAFLLLAAPSPPSLGATVTGAEPGLVGALGSMLAGAAGPIEEPAEESTRDGAMAAMTPEPSVPAACESGAASAAVMATRTNEVFMVLVGKA